MLPLCPIRSSCGRRRKNDDRAVTRLDPISVYRYDEVVDYSRSPAQKPTATITRNQIMKFPVNNRIVWMVSGGCLVGMGMLLGAGLMNHRGATEATTALASFNETLLHASSASPGENFALATGAVDEDAEGVFVLDYLTGILKCAVLNHRTGKFAALFTTNVTKDLGASKNPKYQMVTGLVNFNRGATPMRPGMSVVYVLDSSSGRMAAYGIPWRRDAAATGRPQLGMLQTIDGLLTRTIQIREQ